jgi:hypothetical protein
MRHPFSVRSCLPPLPSDHIPLTAFILHPLQHVLSHGTFPALQRRVINQLQNVSFLPPCSLHCTTKTESPPYPQSSLFSHPLNNCGPHAAATMSLPYPSHLPSHRAAHQCFSVSPYPQSLMISFLLLNFSHHKNHSTFGRSHLRVRKLLNESHSIAPFPICVLPPLPVSFPVPSRPGLGIFSAPFCPFPALS